MGGGSTGFLHQDETADTPAWTDFASGESTSVPVAWLPTGSLHYAIGAGDVQLVLSPSPTQGAGWVTPLDPHTGEQHDVQLPPNYRFMGTIGDKMLALDNTPTARGRSGVLIDAAPGSTGSLPITGIPSGAFLSYQEVQRGAADDRSAVILYGHGGTYHYAVLDAATAVFTPIPGDVGGWDTHVMLSSDRLAWWQAADHTLHWVPRDDPSAPAREFSYPADSRPEALIGGTLLTSEPETDPHAYLGRRVTARPLDGGEPKTLLSHYTNLNRAVDGSVLSVGGSGIDDWAIRRFTEGSDGTLTQKVIEPLPPLPAQVLGLNLYRGELTVVDTSQSEIGIDQRDVGIGAIPVAGDSESVYADAYSIAKCAVGSQCVRTVEGNRNGVSYLTGADGLTYLETRPSHTKTQLPDRAEPGIPDITSRQVVDASADYVVVDGINPKTQYVIAPDHGKIVRSRPVQAAALWYDTLWSASTSTSGTVTAEKLTLDASTPGKPVRTVKTGVACVPTEMQASARWLYWSCGDGKQAGVYDLAKNHGFAVPSGPSMLGDGYVVRHDRNTGALKLTDFHTGSPIAERVLVALPAGKLKDDRRITWAVDKYSGHIAYLDDAGRVHVHVDGVANSAPVIGTMQTPAIVRPRGSIPWYAEIWLSRPVDSWEMSAFHKITGRRVATLRGTAPRGDGPIVVSWNGKEANGAIPDSGAYTWKLSAKYDGRTTAVQVGSGAVTVYCGRTPVHVYDCDGVPDLVAVRTDGKALSWTGSNKTLSKSGYTANWPTSSLLVPIGDFNDDGYADMLVRDSKGAVRVYRGTGLPFFSRSRKYTLIGTGWNRYNLLTSPGDLTGDGHDDLVARDKAGALWLYAATGKGAFKARVRIATGQAGYTKLVGVGDLNGDGRGDMIGTDKSGNLWRWFGGKNRFGSRVKIGSGFKGYNAVVGIGDLTQDGHNDLLARDTAGNLYRYSGNTHSTFGTKTRIGTGWKNYKSLV
ncbi:hypothetical protein Psi02_63690 [Planotetraspora silvatica]|uniref:FlgD Ig-like domain-containing protein n=1 Tax=Planotetraspora silvatica TaxID=234614 RepID=A0A8J3USI5_9ACTN|nr:VCBS repeat-containing protein [Planotetraspora silvatica]GII49945.1 hypothetical protein Psi02_63690 [Planotetraspora silvatica]